MNRRRSSSKTRREKLACDADGYVAASFQETLNFWRDWIGHCRYQGRWREMVNRSALTLKLLVSKPHGSLVAAPTFGLPEVIGGARNWDYRYTWIRDASFTIYALMRLGYTQEAGAFNRWIEQRCRELNPDGSLQIMYGIDGAPRPARGGAPTLRAATATRARCASATRPPISSSSTSTASCMDSVYLYNKWGEPISHDFWKNLVRLVDFVARTGASPTRASGKCAADRQEFLYSRLMCWVALDRGIRLARKRSFPAPLERWIRSPRRDLPRHLRQLLGREAAALSCSIAARKPWTPRACSCRW